MTSVEMAVSCNRSPWAPGNIVALVKKRNRVSVYLRSREDNDRKCMYYDCALFESNGTES